MKKIFSIVALAGLAAAMVGCKSEDLLTSFDAGDAVVTITVTCVDINTSSVVTPSVSLTASNTKSYSYSGSNGVFVLSNSAAIVSHDFNVVASYDGDQESATVHVNPLIKGGKANYSVTIVIGTTTDGYSYTLKEVSKTPAYSRVYTTAADTDYTSSEYPEVVKWVKNNTENYVKATVSYDSYTGTDAVSKTVDNSVFTSIVDSYYNALGASPIVKSTDSIDVYASAYSYWSAFVDYTTTTVAYDIVATRTSDSAVQVVGHVSTKNIACEAQYCEVASPDGHGHYIAGHGHGDSENAGGSITYAD